MRCSTINNSCMVTFFSIMLILIGINTFLLLFSVNNNAKRVQKDTSEFSKTTSAKIYPLNIIETNLKKAV